MGVSGSGKSTIALALAKRSHLEFVDGDSLHSPENLAKMSRGVALSDDDRTPWLNAIGRQLRLAQSSSVGLVVACSALKRQYRDLLRTYDPEIFFVMLEGTEALIRSRIEARPHEFMPASLLATQFAILEPLESDERGMCVDIALSPQDIVVQIEAKLSDGAKRS